MKRFTVFLSIIYLLLPIQSALSAMGLKQVSQAIEEKKMGRAISLCIKDVRKLSREHDCRRQLALTGFEPTPPPSTKKLQSNISKISYALLKQGDPINALRAQEGLLMFQANWVLGENNMRTWATKLRVAAWHDSFQESLTAFIRFAHECQKHTLKNRDFKALSAISHTLDTIYYPNYQMTAPRLRQVLNNEILVVALINRESSQQTYLEAQWQKIRNFINNAQIDSGELARLALWYRTNRKAYKNGEQLCLC